MTARPVWVAAGLLGLGGVVLLSAGALTFVREERIRRTRAAHGARGETRLVVLNPNGAELSSDDLGFRIAAFLGGSR